MMIIWLMFSWMLNAFICALPGLFLGLFFNFKHKHILFFILAAILSLTLSVKFSGIAKILAYSALELLGIYVGLFFLIAIKNISAKCGFCGKIRDKFRRKV